MRGKRFVAVRTNVQYIAGQPLIPAGMVRRRVDCEPSPRGTVPGQRSVRTNDVSGAPPMLRSPITTVLPAPPAMARLATLTDTAAARAAGAVPAGTARI